MTKKTAVLTINGIEVEMGSGNVFADRGLLLLSRWGIGPGDRLISAAKANRKY